MLESKFLKYVLDRLFVYFVYQKDSKQVFILFYSLLYLKKMTGHTSNFRVELLLHSLKEIQQGISL